MGLQAARCIAIAPFAFVCLGCGPSGDPLPAASHMAVLSATSSAVAHSARATFRSKVGSSCRTTRTADGCVVIHCDSAKPGGEPAEGGVVTIQGDQTVRLAADNEWAAEGDDPLFANGEEVLFDAAASDEVPAFRGSLKAPSSSSLTAPLPAEEGAPLELVTGESLSIDWVPGNNGLMKFSATSGSSGISCDWTISNGHALILADTLAELPPSDGSDSVVQLWTEQSDVGRVDDWEFLLLLVGEVAGSSFQGYSRAD